MIEDSGTVQNKKIYELTEIYDERNGLNRITPDTKKSQPVIVVDGRGYERVRSNDDRIFDLMEVVDDNLLALQINDEVMNKCPESLPYASEDIAAKVRKAFGSKLWDELSRTCFSCGTCRPH